MCSDVRFRLYCFISCGVGTQRAVSFVSFSIMVLRVDIDWPYVCVCAYCSDATDASRMKDNGLNKKEL